MSPRAFPISQVRIAAEVAIDEGKSLVVTDTHVLVLTSHAKTRATPIVAGDGSDLLETEE